MDRDYIDVYLLFIFGLKETARIRHNYWPHSGIKPAFIAEEILNIKRDSNKSV